MISITAIIKSKTEKLDVVKTTLNQLVTETRKEKACIRYDLHATENTFIIWEEWKDQAGLDIHNNQPYLQNFIAKAGELLIENGLQIYKTEQIL